MLSQKDAVYQATMAVLQQNGIEFEDGQNVREAISDNLGLRGQIRDLVFQGLKGGQVAFGSGEDRRDDRSLRTYATGLISNWFRKDKRLNGNTRYQPTTSRNPQEEGTSFERRIRALEAAIESTDNQELIKSLKEEINDIHEEDRLQTKLAQDVKAGRYKDDFDTDVEDADIETDDEDQQEDDDSGSGREVEQDNPPSMGSGHKGAVTDPEHDMRLKRNETPELLKARQEAGHRGGTSVRDERGSEFFSKIGQKGGLSRGSGDSNSSDEEDEQDQKSGNIFLKMLRKNTA